MAKKPQGINQGFEAEENINANLLIGNVDESALAALDFAEVNPLQGLDAAYSAGQAGFEAGVTKLGIFMGTKICVSTKEKKPRWKAVEGKPGKVMKKLHMFQAVTAGGELLKSYYGLWHTGGLTAMLERVKRNQLIAITYVGLADKPFREGDSLPHVFKLRGKGLEVKMTDLTEVEDDYGSEEATPLTPEQIASLQRTRDTFNQGGDRAVS
jgi:hypothetical protein